MSERTVYAPPVGQAGDSTPPRKPTYAVDLDGTLAEWDQGWRPAGVKAPVGSWIPGAQDALARMLYDGCFIVVHTCRATWAAGGGTDAVDEFVRSGGFTPIHVVGQEMEGIHVGELDPREGEVGVWVGVGKPIASWYIDDRGVPFDHEAGRGWDWVLGYLSRAAA